ncbi:ABC transporter ATP-binding protein [Pseudenhygromyxa sp. WMMC2535]|uniref:ABC transporter ATP-binding protein n=1 Tax=Pseudenhygromyxa sp. WMMC2535 TaxID=2712867 RepID=UPI0015555ED5|nr:ABC transporter ATP-binding protein [Pseudenhygromyxa sp. WMMC2535]NVB37920.1 ABC transporter ATP-binding protein [Pseudenhygromyxa sp. WMMC2535]
MSPPHARARREAQAKLGVREFFGVFRYSRRAIELVWTTSRKLTVFLAALTLVAGLLPAAAAWVSQQIVDAVVAAAGVVAQGGAPVYELALTWVALEGGIMIGLSGTQKGLGVCQSLLRAMLGHRVNVMILDKALSLQLAHFEDSAFYDKLTRARREASSRPLSLVNRTFGLVQNGISLVSYAALLLAFSPWAVAILVLGGLPAFIAEAKFSGDAFRLFRWRSPETRKQMYLETVLAREDYAKEVKLYGLGPLLLQRYREIFALVFAEDRRLTLRRGAWGFGLGLLSTAAFYGAYAWIAASAVRGQISLGEMTMYLLVFRQGQAAVSASLSAIGGMYEDNLYLSNLYEYLDQAVEDEAGTQLEGPAPGDGIRFEGVSFTYPGAQTPALQGVDLHLRPGQSLALVGENGSGKTTLIKLLTRLYQPSEGRVLLDGLDLREWDPAQLRRRVGVIFQDFARYQMIVGENVGAGDVDHFAEEPRWRQAAAMGMADEFIRDMPEGYQTQLGRWFENGRELSGGQWQKIALSRAFMRTAADILVLDEPTAAMDAEAEATVFEHVRSLTADRMAILISHRFSTVRSADHIVVLDHGRVIESGSHEALMARGERYARLFSLQAEGYR